MSVPAASNPTVAPSVGHPNPCFCTSCTTGAPAASTSNPNPYSEPSAATTDLDFISSQLKTIVVMLSILVLLLGSMFGYSLYRQSKIRYCATEEATSAPQQAACLATH